MKRYESFPIGDLVTDIPVDPLHTKELADSIKNRGQLNPVIVREETREVIDGFHRVAAMAELGFDRVECVITPCDDEEFWDFRIIQASLHKNVTFARAIDWMDKVFQLSPWTDRYQNSLSLFHSARVGSAPKEVSEWAESKAKVWGMAPATIENWLYTKESLEPSLLDEIKKGTAGEVPTRTYTEVAQNLPTRPELHRPVVEKAVKEDLSSQQVREVSQALRRAEDEEEVQSILRQPVSRTEEQMVREAKVEKILKEPTVTPAPTERQYELAGLALEVYLDLQQQVHNVKRLKPEILEALTPRQKDELLQVVDDLMTELRRMADLLRGVIEVKQIE